ERLIADIKQLATGLIIDDAKEMGFIPDYTDTLNFQSSYKGKIAVDLVPLSPANSLANQLKQHSNGELNNEN
ncbi:MAG: hypothetical protein ACPGSN_09160, partial [Psychrobium sp.]